MSLALHCSMGVRSRRCRQLCILVVVHLVSLLLAVPKTGNNQTFVAAFSVIDVAFSHYAPNDQEAFNWRRLEAETSSMASKDNIAGSNESTVEEVKGVSSKYKAWESGEEVWHSLQYLIGFAIVSVAAYPLGLLFPTFLKLPLITGYLIIGVLAGSYVSGLISRAAVERLAGTVNSLALAFISLQAGYEIYFPDLKNQMRDIVVTLAGMYAIVMVLTTLVLSLGAGAFFYKEFDFVCQFAISLMFASIAVLGSPATALAIHVEYRTSGPFTNLMIGVTTLAEFVVLISFSVSRIISSIYCSNYHLTSGNFIFVIAVVFANILVGALLSVLVIGLLSVPASSGFFLLRWLTSLTFKGIVWLLIGFGFFQFSTWFSDFSMDLWGVTWQVHFEPLLVCMVASCLAGHVMRLRQDMHTILDTAAPFMYLPFFTMTGAALNLGSVVKSVPLMSVFMSVRWIGIFLGCFLTNRFLLRLPKKIYNNLWLTFTPQAGVALGLANEVLTMSNADWATQFSSTIVAAVVLNQMIGPVLCSLGVKNSGEATVKVPTQRQRQPSAGGREGTEISQTRSGQDMHTHSRRNSDRERQGRVSRALTSGSLGPLVQVDYAAVVGKSKLAFHIAMSLAAVGIHVRVPLLCSDVSGGRAGGDGDGGMGAGLEEGSKQSWELVDTLLSDDLEKRMRERERNMAKNLETIHSEVSRDSSSASTADASFITPAVESQRSCQGAKEANNSKSSAIDHKTDVIVFIIDPLETVALCEKLKKLFGQACPRLIAVIDDTDHAKTLADLGVLLVQSDTTMAHVITNLAIACEEDAHVISNQAWDHTTSHLEMMQDRPDSGGGSTVDDNDISPNGPERWRHKHYSQSLINFHRIDFTHASAVVADIFAHRIASRRKISEYSSGGRRLPLYERDILLDSPYDDDTENYVIHFSPRSASPQQRLRRAGGSHVREENTATATPRLARRNSRLFGSLLERGQSSPSGSAENQSSSSWREQSRARHPREL